MMSPSCTSIWYLPTSSLTTWAKEPADPNVNSPKINNIFSMEIGLQAKQGVAGADQTIQAGFVQAHFAQEHLPVFLLKIGNLRLDGGAQRHHLRAFGRGMFLHHLKVRVILEAALLDIGHIEHRLGGDQKQLLDQCALFLGKIERAHRLGLQVIGQAVEDPQAAAALWMGGIDFIQGNLVQRAEHALDFDFKNATL